MTQEKYIRTKSTQLSKFPELKEISPNLNIAREFAPPMGKVV